MSETPVVLKIDKPHFTVKLYDNLLKIDLKGTVKNEIEEALENKPILRETIGRILGMFVPLHIRLSDIDSVNMDETGNVKINLPRHRNTIIPLEPKEAKKLVEKLNQLIPKEKKRELDRIMKEQKLQKIAEEELELGRVAASFPILQSPELEIAELSEELKKAEEKEEQKKRD